jgi:putative FmdB family regulatory protein
MPIYEYRCESCSNEIEVIQPMGGTMEDRCSKCGGRFERTPSATSLNLGRHASRSAERHSKLTVEQQARLERDRLVEHSKKTGIPVGDLFEVHD